jgi:dolichol-phosphate mannosyltransferase
MARDSVTVLLPALDEEATIGPVIDSIPIGYLAGQGYDVDIVVVDGHSSDRTKEIAVQKGARVLMQEGFGKGDALRAAFADCDGEYLFMMDADSTYPPRHILEMLPLLESDSCEVVMGSRFRGNMLPGSMSRFNHVGNRVLTTIANVLFSPPSPTTDLCTGMWGFQGRIVKELALVSRGFDIEAEIYAKCVKKGIRITEIPIEYRKRITPPKLSSLRDGLRIWGRLVSERLS